MIGPTLNNKPARLSSPPQEEELNPRIPSSPDLSLSCGSGSGLRD